MTLGFCEASGDIGIRRAERRCRHSGLVKTVGDGERGTRLGDRLWRHSGLGTFWGEGERGTRRGDRLWRHSGDGDRSRLRERGDPLSTIYKFAIFLFLYVVAE